MRMTKATALAAAGLAGVAAAATSYSLTQNSPSTSGTVRIAGGQETATASAAPAPPAAALAAAPSFTPSTTDFPNPERGFYRAVWSSNLDQMTAEDPIDAYANGYRLLFARINLENYRNTDDLPDAYLNALRTRFGYARSAGVKLIVRAVYNYPAGEANYETAQDASLARIKQHLLELAPVFQENADVIAFVQAGFIGAWGEWHTSSNNLHSSATARTEVKNALLSAVPSTRFVQFRYPWHIREWAGTLPSVSSAISSNFRLGFHNDCFLSSVEDVGTYSTDATIRAGERDYADQLGNVGPVGGETCNSTWSSTAVRRTSCNDILTEGAKYNFTYLNIQYWRPEFHDQWIANGCMPEVQRRMGYRLALTSASHNDTVNRGATFNVAVGIQNSGWARIYNPRQVQVILQNTSTNAARRIVVNNVDPRSWTPGTTATPTLQAIVPSNLARGQYRVLIALPDPAASLSANAKYAIRFANENNASANQYWDSNLAAFSIGTNVQVN